MDTWRIRGPKKARFNAKKRGWFDSAMFKDCLDEVFIAALQKLPGKKVLTGDNLSSHFSVAVINTCKENDIEFVCLPANSTDKLQTLNFKLFAAMKVAWRKELTRYKDANPKIGTLPKEEFSTTTEKSCC